MIRIKPNPQNVFICPECRTDQPRIHEIKVQSINVVADCTCIHCGFDFYQTLPVGHTTDYSLSIGKKNEKLYKPDESRPWLSNSFLKAHKEKRKQDVEIEKIVFKKCDHVIVLNTLDSLYGHVLLKLYNAFYHLNKQTDVGLVLIIPKIFLWLIPEGCAEVWVVDLKLGELVYGYEAIENFVSKELERFDEVYLSKAYSHPDFGQANITRLTGVRPFDLKKFSSLKPTFTFVLREDRWWFRTAGDYWFYRVCRKLKILNWGSRILSRRQNSLVKQTIRLIKKQLPDAKVYVVGLGRTGNFSGYAIDERQWNVSPAVENAWCSIYAQSHVVIGVHGSNMLLPTAHAAGCVEVLPGDRYGNMVQDLSVRYNNRLQLFFYRFADQFSRPASITEKAVAMIRDYALFHNNMCKNIYTDDLPNDTTPVLHHFSFEK